GSGPPVLVKQMSLVQAVPVNEKTVCDVCHVQAAPTPVEVPAGREEAKPPGPPETQLNVKVSPIALFVTLFLIVVGNVETIGKLSLLSLAFALFPSRSMFWLVARAGLPAPMAI